MALLQYAIDVLDEDRALWLARQAVDNGVLGIRDTTAGDDDREPHLIEQRVVALVDGAADRQRGLYIGCHPLQYRKIFGVGPVERIVVASVGEDVIYSHAIYLLGPGILVTDPHQAGGDLHALLAGGGHRAFNHQPDGGLWPR